MWKKEKERESDFEPCPGPLGLNYLLPASRRPILNRGRSTPRPRVPIEKEQDDQRLLDYNDDFGIMDLSNTINCSITVVQADRDRLIGFISQWIYAYNFISSKWGNQRLTIYSYVCMCAWAG